MRPQPRRTARFALAAVVVLPLVAVTVQPVSAVSPLAVIAEVYGGGGNVGASFTHDFVEVGNRGTTAASLDGWSVQYLPAQPGPSSQWQSTSLSGSVAPGDRYLVSQARGTGGTAELPTADASGSIALSASQGIVALAQGTDPLTCRSASECLTDSRIVDLVGYGAATVFEGDGPAPAASNTTSVARNATQADTDANDADFRSGPPTPTNSGGEQGGETAPEPVAARIHQIQGTSWLSPLDGRQVLGVPGVVTARRSFGSARGFWMSDPQGDDDPRSSEGLFVFTGATTPAVEIGDAVEVDGTVKEFYPANPASTPYHALTELTNARWTVVSSGHAVPGAQFVKPDTVPEDLTAQPGGTIDGRTLAPDTYALDFWESREGMSVQLADARIVGPSTRFNDLYVTTKPAQYPSARGGTVYTGYDNDNTGVVKIESLIPFAERPFPVADAGDVLAGTTLGPVEYDQFGGYTLLATRLGRVESGELKRETTRKQRADELAVASYNVENLSAADNQATFDALAAGIVENLAAPDIVTLEEIQDDNGPAATGDGVVSAEQTLRRFVDAIVKAGGPRYKVRQIDPEDGADGGQPGGNIRVGFLFNPDRVSFVDRAGGDATTPTKVFSSRGKPHLSLSPGRIDPEHDAWRSSRKPLAAEFVFRGRTLFVVANHFTSKGADQPVHGRFQPPARSSEVQRGEQARVVRNFVDRVVAIDPAANVVVAGDLNDYQFSPAVRTFTSDGLLRALIDTLPAQARYGHVLEGRSQVLDHILVSAAPRVAEFDVVHINAEFHDQTSDHDPLVARLQLGAGKSAAR